MVHNEHVWPADVAFVVFSPSTLQTINLDYKPLLFSKAEMLSFLSPFCVWLCQNVFHYPNRNIPCVCVYVRPSNAHSFMGASACLCELLTGSGDVDLGAWRDD